jgi:hypothetical protein
VFHYFDRFDPFLWKRAEAKTFQPEATLDLTSTLSSEKREN